MGNLFFFNSCGTVDGNQKSGINSPVQGTVAAVYLPWIYDGLHTCKVVSWISAINMDGWDKWDIFGASGDIIPQ